MGLDRRRRDRAELAVGEPDGTRNTPQAAARLTAQPYQNLSLSTGTLPWPIDANDPALHLIPLVEPIWGLLRDSDPFVGRNTGAAQPNFAVAFELPVP